MIAKIVNKFMYLSPILAALGIVFLKQSTILAEVAVVLLALFVPMANAWAITKNEQLKRVVMLFGVVEGALVFSLIVGNTRW